MAGATRLELATSGVTGRRSNQTELRPHSDLPEIFQETRTHSLPLWTDGLL